MASGENQDSISFGAWVRQRRLALNLTQAALARQVGCAPVTIKKIERDERRPSRQMAELLADHLAIPPAARQAFLRMGHGQFVPDATSPQGAIPPPAFLQAAKQPDKAEPSRFVARERELAALKSHLDDAAAGRAGVLFILGEAGSGKTTLMAEFARQAQQAYPGLVIAAGHCNAQAGSGDPYLPFRDVLGMLAGDLEAQWASGALARDQALQLWSLLPDLVQALLDHGPDLVDGLVPGSLLLRRIGESLPERVDWLTAVQALRERQSGRPPDLQPGDLLEQVTQVLHALARRHPLLLLIDDLQWIDSASTNLLFHLGRRLAGSRILLVGAYRPVEVGPGRAGGDPAAMGLHPLEPVIAEFRRYFGAIQLDLGEQALPEKRAFLDALLDSEPNRLDGTFRENLFLHTQGQPLFTVEVLRDMQANGHLVRDAGGQWIENRAAFARKLPARVEAIIEERFARLDRDLQDLLTVASVEGELFTAQVVARVRRMDERLALERLSRDLERGQRIVREQGEVVLAGKALNRYRFGHVLFQEYLYDRLGQGERRLLHRQVGEALEASLDIQTARIYAALLDRRDDLAEVLEGPYPEWLVEFGPSLVYHFWKGQDWSKTAACALYVGARAMKVYALREAIAAFERAIQALDHLPAAPYELAFEAILRWESAAFKYERYDVQRERLARAEHLARDHDDRVRLIQALHWTANVHLARGLWSRAGPALTECLALAEAAGDEALCVRPVYFKGLMTALIDPRSALPWLDRALDLARRFADPHVEALTLGTQAQVYAQLGQYARAREAVHYSYEALQRSDSPLTASDADLLAGWAYLAMGDTRRGLEYGQRSVQKALATDNMDCICYGFACVGYGNLELQHISEATSAFEEAVRRSATSGAIIPQLLAQAGLAMAQFCGGRVEAISDLEAALASMRSYNDPVGAAETAHMLGTCLIQLGDFNRAEDYLNQALDFYRRTEMRPYLVRTLFTQARLFERQGRAGDARDVRAQAETMLAALADEFVDN